MPNPASGPVPQSDPGGGSDDAASLAARVEGRLDDLAQRFEQRDWIELFAAILLAFATIMAAWSAYQATRWSGVQTVALSEASALRAEGDELMTVAEAGLEIDVEMFSAWLVLASEGNEAGTEAIRGRLRPEFQPAFETWLDGAPLETIPAGRPFDLPQYEQTARTEARQAAERFRDADEAATEARRANQTGDDFVLVAVVMAMVLFFAGVSTKLRSHWVRVLMMVLALAFFLGGLAFMLSLPQNVGL